MDVFLHCLRKSCLHNDDEENENHTEETPGNLVVDRDDVATLYQPPSPTGSNDSDDYATSAHGQFIVDFDDDGSNQEEEDLIRNEHRKTSDHMNSFFSFLQNLGNTRGGEDDSRGRDNSDGNSIQTDGNIEGNHLLFNPPLKEAHSSIATNKDDIPTIALEEVVLPGSELQKQMSIALKDQGYGGESEEEVEFNLTVRFFSMRSKSS